MKLSACAPPLCPTLTPPPHSCPFTPTPPLHTGPHTVEEGASRECVGSHDNICALFPKLSTSRALHMVQLTPGASGAAPLQRRAMKLGVVLSGGQAPGEQR